MKTSWIQSEEETLGTQILYVSCLKFLLIFLKGFPPAESKKKYFKIQYIVENF